MIVAIEGLSPTPPLPLSLLFIPPSALGRPTNMPPKQPEKPASVPSKSRELIPLGPRHLSAKHNHSRRDEHGHLPTTAHALVLRNGKHGAMGTGELMSSKKISGRQKLDLLAGE